MQEKVQFKGQHLQDKFVIEYFAHKQGGTFVDIGAYDGVTISNTYVLEKHFGWSGLCFEPMPHQFKKLQENRPGSINYDYAIYDKDGEETFTLVDNDGYPDMLSGITKDITFNHMSGILSEMQRLNVKQEKIKVKTKRLNGILKTHDFKDIDFLSIDTEGSELPILKDIDFSEIKITLIILENKFNEKNIRNFLQEKGFSFLKKIGIDDAFVTNNTQTP